MDLKAFVVTFGLVFLAEMDIRWRSGQVLWCKFGLRGRVPLRVFIGLKGGSFDQAHCVCVDRIGRDPMGCGPSSQVMSLFCCKSDWGTPLAAMLGFSLPCSLFRSPEERRQLIGTALSAGSPFVSSVCQFFSVTCLLEL